MARSADGVIKSWLISETACCVVSGTRTVTRCWCRSGAGVRRCSTGSTLPKETGAEQERQGILAELLGEIGAGSWIMPRLQCDYGYLVRIGANSFLNYDAVLLDCAPITIGDDVSVGPRAQFLTALRPMDEHELRRRRWERAEPISVGDNVWFGGGVIVCAGVTAGANTVVGTGSVVTRDLPPGVFAAGNPARVVRQLNR
ncbi:maltose O-acetyltransferase [Saccharomonospora amisosensis]|uniref:Acetyltransferase n=1 Tax=Saccharomonospora amisosensis TaxID=1128677 RepID=A0A7X5UKZ2_9PSEU|nr:maltose O-acetyltransferase [Saccharomonospora amisosensis]